MSIEPRPETRLPADPGYWDQLAARSVDAAFGGAMSGGVMSDGAMSGTAAAGRAHPRRAAAPDAWWRGMSDTAFVLAASAVLALIGAPLLVGERSPRATMDAHAFTQLHFLAEPRALTAALAPDDPMLATLLDEAGDPPPASVLLRLVAMREEGR